MLVSIGVSKNANLGTKRICRACGARFYDFSKPEPHCPKCGVIFDVNAEPELAPLPPDEEAAAAAERKASKKKKKPGRRDSDGDSNNDDENEVDEPADPDEPSGPGW